MSEGVQTFNLGYDCDICGGHSDQVSGKLEYINENGKKNVLYQLFYPDNIGSPKPMTMTILSLEGEVWRLDVCSNPRCKNAIEKFIEPIKEYVEDKESVQILATEQERWTFDPNDHIVGQFDQTMHIMFKYKAVFMEKEVDE